MDEPELTHGSLLDGRVRYAQFRHGYRTGIEPVLLAAGVPARAGQLIIEAGAGAGAGLLCLAARVPGIAGLGIERDPALARLAAANADANELGGSLRFRAGAIEQPEAAEAGRFHHAMANPPWHDPAGSPSPDPGRDSAKRATPDTISSWIAALSYRLKHRGTLSLIIPPGQLDAAIIAGAAHGMGSLRITPFWPKPGRAARMLLLQSIRGGRTPGRILPGLVLHDAAGAYTPAAHDVLRLGAAID